MKNLLKRLKNLWAISNFHPETVGKNDFKADLISDGFIGEKQKDGSVAVRRMAIIVEDEPEDLFDEKLEEITQEL